jgi:hypothetical protein
LAVFGFGTLSSSLEFTDTRGDYSPPALVGLFSSS